MLYNFSELQKYVVKATNDEIGKVEDLYFEDTTWGIHYLVADTGNWLAENLVLLTPTKISEINEKERQVLFELSKKKIEDSPPVYQDKPVYRQKELEILDYYKDWPHYWAAFSQAPPPTMPVILARRKNKDSQKSSQDYEDQNNAHLRSCQEVTNYNLHATDGKFGHVEDFLVNDQNWKIEFFVVDTKNWLPFSKKVLISPKWINKIIWASEEVKVNLAQDLIKNSPEYDHTKPILQEYIDVLYEYYNLHE